MIVKTRRTLGEIPNLDDYERVRADFSWTKARNELNGLPDGKGLNIAFEAVDRHASGRFQTTSPSDGLAKLEKLATTLSPISGT